MDGVTLASVAAGVGMVISGTVKPSMRTGISGYGVIPAALEVGVGESAA